MTSKTTGVSTTSSVPHVPSASELDGTNGRISSIGNNFVTYGSDGRISSIGDKFVTYGSNGRISSIGDHFVTYS
jgi:hypothetical protein